MPSVLVTGASRGIGLEFARQYAADGWQVYAACRDPAAAKALGALDGRVSVHALEVSDRASVRRLALGLAGEPIDVLINNAAIYGPRANRLGAIDYAGWEDTLRVNLLGPFAVAESLVDNVAKSARKTMVALSSRMGSISLAPSSTEIPYNTSKVALNMAVKCLALQLKERGIISIAITPGWVRTDMGGPQAALSVEESVSGMRGVIARLTPADSGRFFGHDGSLVPW